MPLARGATDAVVAATVLTVNVEVPEPPATEVGLNAQVAGRAATGVTVQVKATALLNPFWGLIPTVDVAATPALTEAGARGVAARMKSAIGAAVTVKVAVAEWGKRTAGGGALDGHRVSHRLPPTC